MDKQKLSVEYLQVKSDIKAHLTLIQILMNHIKVSKTELENLTEKSKDVQKQLEELINDKKETK